VLMMIGLIPMMDLAKWKTAVPTRKSARGSCDSSRGRNVSCATWGEMLLLVNCHSSLFGLTCQEGIGKEISDGSNREKW
jgi:hypothetical protein